MSKISLDVIKILLSTEEMKKVTGGCGGGNVCWHYCYTYSGERTASVWGTCYDAYHECNRSQWTAWCGCNG